MDTEGTWMDVDGAELRVGDRVRWVCNGGATLTPFAINRVGLDDVYTANETRWSRKPGAAFGHWQRFVPPIPDCHGHVGETFVGHVRPGQYVQSLGKITPWVELVNDSGTTDRRWSDNDDRANPTHAVCPTCERMHKPTMLALPPGARVEYVPPVRGGKPQDMTAHVATAEYVLPDPATWAHNAVFVQSGGCGLIIHGATCGDVSIPPSEILGFTKCDGAWVRDGDGAKPVTNVDRALVTRADAQAAVRAATDPLAPLRAECARMLAAGQDARDVLGALDEVTLRVRACGGTRPVDLVAFADVVTARRNSRQANAVKLLAEAALAVVRARHSSRCYHGHSALPGACDACARMARRSDAG